MKFEGIVPVTKKTEILAKHGPNGHWDFPEQMGNGVGFIYVMFDTILNRAYLGKKLYRSNSVAKRGKESDWRSYVSSSNLLKEILKERPLSEFEFICIEQYQTKGTLSYAETWSLCYVEAPTSVSWYNTLIEKVSWPVKESITFRHKQRLSEVMKRIV